MQECLRLARPAEGLRIGVSSFARSIMVTSYSQVTDERPCDKTQPMKTPEKRSAPVYSGCKQQAKTHRSETHVSAYASPLNPTLTPVRYIKGRIVDKIMACGILA